MDKVILIRPVQYEAPFLLKIQYQGREKSKEFHTENERWDEISKICGVCGLLGIEVDEQLT